MIHLAVMGSTRGTHLTTLIDAIQQNRLAAVIELVISNHADAPILAKAKAAGLNAIFIDPKDETREAYDKKILQTLSTHCIDLIVLTGYMRILTDEFVKAWNKKIINVHPSLLPAFAGKMDLAVHRAVLAAHCKETGCTVHFVTSDVDAGPIILQEKCLVEPNDTPETLKQKVQALEAESLVKAIQQFNH
jgi:phosphoribosylglycinamide formyltransferase 1